MVLILVNKTGFIFDGIGLHDPLQIKHTDSPSNKTYIIVIIRYLILASEDLW